MTVQIDRAIAASPAAVAVERSAANNPHTFKPTDVFLTARWRWLLMLNYAIDARVLAPLVPRGTELDSHDGQTFVSLVGFMFEDTRLMGWRIPAHQRFAEVNLRFYVRREEQGELRRGVVFVREIVHRRAVAAVARWVYHENYVVRPMRHQTPPDGTSRGAPSEVSFAWKQSGRWHDMRATIGGACELPADGSPSQFIIEHYWGYTRQPDGGTLEYRVEHRPWRVWSECEASIDVDALTNYGSRFAAWLAEPPRSALVADGSEVSVHRGRRIAPR